MSDDPRIWQFFHALNHERERWQARWGNKMPPISKLQAPKGMFRVVGVDTFSDEDWLVGDFASEAEARKKASESGGVMLKVYVYDDEGRWRCGYGEY